MWIYAPMITLILFLIIIVIKKTDFHKTIKIFLYFSYSLPVFSLFVIIIFYNQIESEALFRIANVSLILILIATFFSIFQLFHDLNRKQSQKENNLFMMTMLMILGLFMSVVFILVNSFLAIA